MQRTYSYFINEHLQNDRQMLFLIGPRQVGKTTISKLAEDLWSKGDFFYFNWDNSEHQQLIISGGLHIIKALGIKPIIGKKQTLIVFDELHKFGKWKQFIKGFFDTYEGVVKIIITGSARLDLYKKQGDSLMGRYFCYHIHPLSIREIIRPRVDHAEIAEPLLVPQETFLQLLNFGGFPEPFTKQNIRFSNKWHSLREYQLFREDLRDLTQIQELAQIEFLGTLLQEQAGQLINYTNLAKTIKVSVPTVIRWMNCLENFYFCFKVHPWFNNVKRSLVKEPKIYLWDWSLIKNPGMRAENFVASHLLKAVHFWQDLGLGNYQLNFMRNKEKQEVDFLIVKNNTPWMLIEVNLSNKTSLNQSLFSFKKEINAKHAFQLVFDLPSTKDNCFNTTEPIIIPVQNFLSQLV